MNIHIRQPSINILSGPSNWSRELRGKENVFQPVPMHHGIRYPPVDRITNTTENNTFLRMWSLKIHYSINIVLVFYWISALSIRSCPSLRTPPPEVVARGQESVIGYLKRLSGGFTENWRTKLMLVGLGGAGKTRWMKRQWFNLSFILI